MNQTFLFLQAEGSNPATLNLIFIAPDLCGLLLLPDPPAKQASERTEILSHEFAKR